MKVTFEASHNVMSKTEQLDPERVRLNVTPFFSSQRGKSDLFYVTVYNDKGVVLDRCAIGVSAKNGKIVKRTRRTIKALAESLLEESTHLSVPINTGTSDGRKRKQTGVKTRQGIR